MKYALRMTETQHTALRSHLFPGDGKEAVALLFCGRRKGETRHVFTVRRVVPVPYEVCGRRPDRITWPTDLVELLLHEAFGKEQAIVKVHSHPVEYRRFSILDDESDRDLFASITGFLNDELPHASVIMLPDGELFGRVLGDEGKVIGPLGSIMAVGHDLRIWQERRPEAVEGFALRHAQAFGSGTTGIFRTLSIAIVGCSGTGSIVAEQLARLGVGRLVLVDPDAVEDKNLNRILNSGKEDAYLARPKVRVLAAAIARMGVNQEVLPLAMNLISPEAARKLAECDIVFGCMDGAEGRHMLNRLATFYVLPYFDVGVRLDADGKGGVNSIAGAVHYLQPGLSSLLSRGSYDMKRVEAEEIRRTDPELYRRRVKEGYLRGVEEDRPAVISVNMFFASLAVNELLARLHPYRNLPNEHFACVRGSLSEVQFYPEGESAPCTVLQRHVGRGDVVPLLDRPALS
jgi:hypothetical protein